MLDLGSRWDVLGMIQGWSGDDLGIMRGPSRHQQLMFLDPNIDLLMEFLIYFTISTFLFLAYRAFCFQPLGVGLGRGTGYGGVGAFLLLPTRKPRRCVSRSLSGPVHSFNSLSVFRRHLHFQTPEKNRVLRPLLLYLVLDRTLPRNEWALYKSYGHDNKSKWSSARNLQFWIGPMAEVVSQLIVYSETMSFLGTNRLYIEKWPKQRQW